MPAQNPSTASDLIADFARSVARAAPAGAQVRTRAVASAEISRGNNFSNWVQPLAVAPSAPIWIGAPEETWTALGAGSFSDLAGRIITTLCAAIAARLGIACDAGPGREAEPTTVEENLICVDIDVAGRQYPLYAAFPMAVLDAVETHRAPAASVDLLLDVELPVSVSFGRTLLPVREILRMTTGTMIELNRHVNDYVDVIVNNCIIARGEVVVIEGNYGIRVQEIVSRKERAMLQDGGRPAPLKASA